jgi:hypothetical protein
VAPIVLPLTQVTESTWPYDLPVFNKKALSNKQNKLARSIILILFNFLLDGSKITIANHKYKV